MIKTANQISMIYIFVGITWIFVSDRIDVGSNWIYYQTFKGIGYVICTGILLWLVIRRKERKNEVIRENLEASLQKIKQAEQRLKDKGSLLRTVIDNLPDHIFVKDLQGKVMIGNAALVKTFGFDSENDLLGKDIRELIPNDQGVRFFEDDFRVMQTDTKLLNKT
jgi:PAS domain-containing protein